MKSCLMLNRKILTIAVLGFILFNPFNSLVAATTLPTAIPDTKLDVFLDKVFGGLFAVFIIVAAIFFVIAGYQYVTALGDPEKIKKANNAVLYGVIAVAVAAGSRALVWTITLFLK